MKPGCGRAYYFALNVGMNGLRIFAIGTAGLFLVFSIVLYTTVASIIAAGFMLVAIIGGFLITPKKEYRSLWMPAIVTEAEALPILIYDGTPINAPYPQLLTFRAETRLFPMLFFVTIVPIVILIWAMQFPLGLSAAHSTSQWALLYFSEFSTIFVSALITAWIRERWLVRHGMFGLAALHRSRQTAKVYRFEYRRSDGTYGGNSYLWRRWYPRENSNVTPVLQDPREHDRAVAATQMVFHRFRLVDRRHLQPGG